MSLFLLSIWYVGREFIDAIDYIKRLSLNIHWWLKGLQWLYFRWHLWINSDLAFLTIPFVAHYSILAFDLTRRYWIHWCCLFNTAAVTEYSLMISRSIVTMFLPAIYGSAMTTFLTIPFVSHESIFAIDLMRRLWIYWRYRLHKMAVT